MTNQTLEQLQQACPPSDPMLNSSALLTNAADGCAMALAQPAETPGDAAEGILDGLLMAGGG